MFDVSTRVKEELDVQNSFLKRFSTPFVVGVVLIASSGVAYADARPNQSANAVASQVDHAARAAGVGDSDKGVFSREGEVSGVEDGLANVTRVVSVKGRNYVVQSVSSGEFAVSLPGSKGERNVSGDGSTVVISDSTGSGHVSTAVTSADAGNLRAHTVLLDPQAPGSYVYGFDDANSLELDPAGGATLFVGRGPDKTKVGAVKSAWARDAKGRAVPTHYEVSGNRLIQVVDHKGRGFAYPIVADPSWSGVWSAIKKGGSKVASAAKWLGSKASWVVGKSWSGVTTVAPKGYKAGRFLVKKAGPLGVALCAVGGGWAWYRSDANGVVRVGDAVSGSLL